MACYYIFILIITLSVTMCCGRSITDILSYYNTLKKEHFRHKVFRRSLTRQHERDIDFVSHGKRFHMKLVQSKDIFDSSFHVVSVDRYGKQNDKHVNLDFFYEGRIANDPASRVVAHLEDDGMITATIDTADETYVVEPMWRHVSDNNVTHDMIVYKATDVKWNFTNPSVNKLRICGNNDTDAHGEGKESHDRFRRSSSECSEYKSKENTCKLHLVSDYSFFLNVAGKKFKTAVYYMLHAIKRANNIYKNTCWDTVGKGIGLQVTKVTVHNDQYSVYSSYNRNKRWNPNQLLHEFNREGRSFCLAHLFTYHNFDNGALGLAYIASTKSTSGGICSSLNSGITTHVHQQQRLTTLQAQLVTTHEVGHNFGARHDSKKCAPGGNDGNYIMFEFSVTGEKRFNREFSRCSKQRIEKVLQERTTCLEARATSMCGNFIVEGTEECDGGTNKHDPCCNKKCKLIDGADCSDTNDLCCTNCNITKAKGKVCREKNIEICENETRCDGRNKTCPEEIPKLKSGKECTLPSLRKGTCSYITGSCVSICGNENVTKPCPCTTDNDVCKVCCRPIGSNEACRLLIPNQKEGNGVRCNTTEGKGICEDGKCNLIKQPINPSFRDLLKNFSLNMVIRYVKSHIVITILFLSLLLWLPIGCIVNMLDNAQEKRNGEPPVDSFIGPTKQNTSFKKSGKSRFRKLRRGSS